MLGVKACQNLMDEAFSYAKRKSDGIEITITGGDIATSRFAYDNMTQNQAPIEQVVSARVILNGRQARLSTDSSTSEAVRQLIDDACSVAKMMEKDKELLPLTVPGKVDGKPIVSGKGLPSRFDKNVANMTAMQRSLKVRSMMDVVKSAGLDSAGMFASGSSYYAVGNSKGVFAYHQETNVESSITVIATDSSGWAKADGPSLGDVDAENLAKIALQKAVASADPVECPPGKYTVILEPSAVLDLLSFLWPDFAGTSHTDKLSCLLGKVGKQVFGANISVSDDVFHRLQSGPDFDGEGVARKKVALVENGVVQSLVHGRLSAKKFGVHSTGHGLQQPSAVGECPTNIVVAGGDCSLQSMVSSLEQGILLTRVWYVREVDPSVKLLTGMTRDGTFLVENGQITRGVRNFRFNVSLIELLNKVLELGPTIRSAGEEGIPAVVPAMKVADFNFTSQTKFYDRVTELGSRQGCRRFRKDKFERAGRDAGAPDADAPDAGAPDADALSAAVPSCANVKAQGDFCLTRWAEMPAKPESPTAA